MNLGGELTNIRYSEGSKKKEIRTMKRRKYKGCMRITEDIGVTELFLATKELCAIEEKKNFVELH